MTALERNIFEGIVDILGGGSSALGDRTTYIGSSDISGCLYKAFLGKRCGKSDDCVRNVHFLRGHIAEGIVVSAMEQKGYKFTRQFEAVHPEKPYLKSHIDILFSDQGKTRFSVLEIKSTASKLPDVPYVGWTRQLAFQMGILKSLFPDARVHGSILGLDIVNAEIRLYPVLEDEAVSVLIEACLKRGDRLYEALKIENIQEASVLAEPGPLCSSCPYCQDICNVFRVDGDGVVSLDPVAELVEEYWELKREVEQKEERLNEVRDRIIAAMGDAEHGKVSSFTVEKKVVEFTRLDTKALKSAHPEIYQEFAKKSASIRLTVKRVDGE